MRLPLDQVLVFALDPPLQKELEYLIMVIVQKSNDLRQAAVLPQKASVTGLCTAHGELPDKYLQVAVTGIASSGTASRSQNFFALCRLVSSLPVP